MNDLPPGTALSRRHLLTGAALTGLSTGVLGGAARAATSTASARPVVRVVLQANGQDQSAALQKAIDAAPDGARVRLPAGSYRLDRKIEISGRRGLTIAGPSSAGQEFVGYTDRTGFEVGEVSADGRYSYRQHWQVANSQDITLARIRVKGPNRRRDGAFTAYQENVAFEHAFCVSAPSTGIRVVGCSFQDVNGDGVYVGGTGEPARDIAIVRMTGSYCGRQSIGVTNVDGLLVRDTRISGGGRSGVDIEPNGRTQYVRNVVLQRVDMGSKFYPFVIGGITDEVRRENITLLSCTAHDSSSSHPAVLASRNGRNLRIIGHRDTRQGSLYGIIATSWEGVEVRDSLVTSGRHTPTSYAVRLTDCSGSLSLRGNEFNGDLYAFDELFEASGATNAKTVQHTGNSWAMGKRTD